jgi:hypothetical protein
MSERRDRRTIRHTARHMMVPCSLERIVEEGPWEVMVVIVSASAIRIHTRQLFRPGMHLAVDLPDGQGHLKACLFQVTSGKERMGGPEWIVEGIFVNKLAQAEVDAVRPKLAAHAPPGSRRTKTHGGGWKTVCRRVRVKVEGPWLMTLQDISHRGIGLIADRPFEPGTFLKVELPSVRRKHLHPKLIRVTHAQRQPGNAGWMLGGVFLRGLSEEELQVLL